MVQTEREPRKTRILILGGGFAGLNTVLALEKLLEDDERVEILLINRENYILFTPMLSEVAIGTVDPRHIVTPIRELCWKTEFHRGEVIQIDLEAQQVDVLYNGLPHERDTLRYDHLVLAMGSTTNVMLVPGVDKYAFNFKEIGDALLIRNHILEMFERADTTANPEAKRAMLTFSVIGGGYSGVEIAAAIQSMTERLEPLYPTIMPEDIRVVIVEAQGRILGTLPEDLSAYAHKELLAMGVEVLTDTKTQQVFSDCMALSNGETIRTHTVVWATGVVIPPLLMNLQCNKDIKGRPLGTPELRLKGYQNVWAIGDNVLTPLPDASGFYPPTAQVSVQQGRFVAKNIVNALQGKPLEIFQFKQKGEMVVLGERSAVAIVSGYKLKGFAAWVLWRLFYLSKLPRWTKKIRVAVDWILNLFGPTESTQIKVHMREASADPNEVDGDRLNIPEAIPRGIENKSEKLGAYEN